MRIYHSKIFSIKYPAKWTISENKGIIDFQNEDQTEEITISHTSGINFPIEKTKRFLAELSQQPGDTNNVSVNKIGNLWEFYYEYEDQRLNWVLKVIRRNDDFYLITMDCIKNKWNESKIKLIEIINTFEIK